MQVYSLSKQVLGNVQDKTEHNSPRNPRNPGSRNSKHLVCGISNPRNHDITSNP